MTYEKLKDLKNFAARLNGREIGNGYKIILAEEEATLKKEGVVMVVNDNDDHHVRLYGAINNAKDPHYGAHIIHFIKGELVKGNLVCNKKGCPYFDAYHKDTKYIKEIIDVKNGFTSNFDTNIPCETFVFKKNGSQNCIGLLFYADDVQEKKSIEPSRIDWKKSTNELPSYNEHVLIYHRKSTGEIEYANYLNGVFKRHNGEELDTRLVPCWARINLPENEMTEI